MALDMKDPADKAAVQELIDAALETALEEANGKFEKVQKRLLDDVKKAKAAANKDADPNLQAEVDRLTSELETLQTAHTTATKDLAKATKAAKEFEDKYNGESKVTTSLLVDTGLTDQLTAVKVAPQFLPAVKAMLAPGVVIKAEGDKRVAMFGDKPLADHVKAWAASDEGKHYVAAGNNSGGGADGGKGQGGGGKTMTRSAYDVMPPAQAAAFFAEGGTLTEG